MTFGEKLSKLRRENNYTQEQLAELLDVSRQAVGKWESDLAFPETEKLVRLSSLFGCTVDYLLKEDSVKEKRESTHTSFTLSDLFSLRFFERKSKRTVCGMPLYHIGRNAHGFFAIGLSSSGVFSLGLLSRGIVSAGLLSMGIFSFGILSLGVVALGCFVLGLLAFGAIAAGVFAAGAITLGILSFGALAVGCFSAGALAVGKYMAVGDHAYAMIAVGKTVAEGSVYRHLGTLSGADRGAIMAALDAHVPPFLAWAKEIFRVFVR